MKIKNNEDVSFLYTHVNYEYEVESFFCLNRVRFSVLWNRMCPSTGEKLNAFYLTEEVFCNREDYRERIIKAINIGEVDENEDLELYLYIKDFDANDFRRNNEGLFI